MKVLYFGTPDVAVPFLEWLIEHEEVVGVVTRPDEPKGRGYSVLPPPVKTLALSKNLPVFQPQGPWNEAAMRPLQDLKADVGVAVAYGRILPRAVYAAPRLGTFNIHFSLLPKYRGAGPMQWALINGEKTTGVTAFWMNDEMDAGPICHQDALDISPNDNAVTLKGRLIQLGVDVMGRVMTDLNKGHVVRNPQGGDVVFAPQLTKETGVIRWDQPAESIVNLIRGVVEWPGASTYFQPKLGEPKQLKIFSAVAIGDDSAKKPGTILGVKKDEGFLIQAQPGCVLIREVQPEGKKRMDAWAFWQGAHLQIGDQLG